MHKRLLSALVLFLPILAHAAGISDYSSHKPPAISLPAAGGSYIDPVFVTKIIRVTDGRYGTRCYHAYSYWPAFNIDETRLVLACDDVALLFRFDKYTDTVTPDGLLQGTDGPHIQYEGAVWSPISADIIYAVDQTGLRLWRVDVGHRGAAGYSLMADFTPQLGTGVIALGLTMSDDANTFAFHTVSRSTGKAVDAVVWVRNLGKVYIMPRLSGEALNECKIDKEAKVLMANFWSNNVLIWDFHTGATTYLKMSVQADSIAGHFDLGADYIANSDGWNTGLVVRDYSSLRSPQNIVRYLRPNGTLNWSLCDHTSLREGIETFVVGSTYCGDNTYAAFEKEVYLAFTDGHGFVRLAHTRSLGNETDDDGRYRAQPRATIDHRGHYIVYTSDLGSSTRTDVMILKVPSAYWPM